MIALTAGGMKYGLRYMMPGGTPGAEVSSDESDLMSSVMQSALRLVSGRANRNELANELSDQLYSNRGDAGDMSELGIEVVKAKTSPAAPQRREGSASPQTGGGLPAEQMTRSGQPRAQGFPTRPAGAAARLTASAGANVISGESRSALAQLWHRVEPYTLELALVPVAFFIMVVVSRRRRRSREAGFMPATMAILPPADSEPIDMKHPVHALKAEEFELLVALIYQRQGYRVSLPSGLGGGRGGDFTLARKSERVLVQCKKLNREHEVSMERVRDLQEAVTAAGVTRGLFIAPCRFTWDARNFAKANRVTLINARTLDELLTAAREQPDEDLLAVSQWMPKFMSKVELTTPNCPACEAKMEQVKASDSSVWVCSQRPDCRGRRSPRKYHKPQPARKLDVSAETVSA